MLSGKGAVAAKDGSENMLSVTGALAVAKGSLTRLGELRVTGEVTGFRSPSGPRGHCYFAVKDAESTMQCIIWGFNYRRMGFALENGQELELTGAFDVYAGNGRMSFIVTSARIAGEGLLRQQVEELRRRLFAEGLMEQSLKKPIAAFCERVCVVTSPTGAVLHDVEQTLLRRNPLVRLTAEGCAVQGADAPPSIISALGRAAARRPDVILLVRGGGSYEDLMAFNDESLARAIASSPVPVLTGIGHAPDHTIADDVSDRFAPTPTAAAEMVAPSLEEIEGAIRGREQRLLRQMGDRLDAEEAFLQRAAHDLPREILASLRLREDRLSALASRPVMTNPMAFITTREDSLSLTADRLYEAMDDRLWNADRSVDNLAGRLPDAWAHAARTFQTSVSRLGAALCTEGRHLLQPYESHTLSLAASLESLSPLAVLTRGYALVENGDGHVVSTASAARPGERLSIHFQDGAVDAVVAED